MWKVIIADDEKLICRLIEALVDWEKLNMRIAGKAENGLEALQMVRELRPHLLITDIRMPGCDGLDLIRQARELSPDIEIVIISGCAHFEYAQTAIAYGVGNYILKPVNQAELNKTLLKSCCGWRRSRRGAQAGAAARPVPSGSGSTSSATCWTAGGSLPRRSWPKIISSTSKAAVFRPSF